MEGLSAFTTLLQNVCVQDMQQYLSMLREL